MLSAPIQTQRRCKPPSMIFRQPEIHGAVKNVESSD